MLGELEHDYPREERLGSGQATHRRRDVVSETMSDRSSTAARARRPHTTVALRYSSRRVRVQGRAARGTGPRAGRRLWGSVLGLILLWGPWLLAPAEEEVVVAINPATPAGATITRNALSAIFGMRLRAWPDGTPIRVYVLPDDNALHVAFSKQILGVFPHQLRTAWDRLVFSGTGQAPLEVADEEEMRARIIGIYGTRPVVVGSEEEMREKLARNAGAIGYLSRTMIDGRVAVLPVN